MTPFESYGYTKDTVFRVCAADEAFPLGTLVQLQDDDGTECPLFNSGTDIAYIFLPCIEYVSGPRNITMNREELTTLINEILDARELRARFSERAQIKFKPGDMVLYRGGLRMVVAVNVNNAQYTVSHDSGWDVAREEELTRYEESRK